MPIFSAVNPLGTSIEANEMQSNSMLIPVGGVCLFLKNLAGVPTMPDEFVECNGQTLSDADSPLNGSVIPNLNNGYYLKGGSTSGSTGGANTHNHKWARDQNDGTTINVTNNSNTITNGSFNSAGSNVTFSNSSGFMDGDYYTDKINNEPLHYEIVFIMRVK